MLSWQRCSHDLFFPLEINFVFLNSYGEHIESYAAMSYTICVFIFKNMFIMNLRIYSASVGRQFGIHDYRVIESYAAVSCTTCVYKFIDMFIMNL